MSQSLKEIIKLSLPLILGQLGQMLVVAGDVFVATKYSTEAVASIGVAAGLTNPLFLFGIGMTMGVSPSFAFLRGKGETIQDKGLTILVFSFSLGLALSVLVLALMPLIDYIGLEPSLIPGIKEYISIVLWSFPFAIAFGGLREFLQSFEEVMVPNLISMGSVLINLLVNYLLVFGLGQWDGMGQVGLAYASLIIRIFMFLALLIFAFRKYPIEKIEFQVMKVLFRFSFPIAFMFFLEVLAFCSVSILSGKLGVVEAAANNIIMTLASIAFMIPLSLSSAAAVKVAHALGVGGIEKVKTHSYAILLLILGFSLFSIVTFVFLPALIMGFMTEDASVITLGIELLAIVAVFQVFDAFQVSLAGILRGLRETRFPSIMVFIGYWIIGIPTGIYLAFWGGQGVHGLWMGLALSLAAVAVALSFFTYHKMKKLV